MIHSISIADKTIVLSGCSIIIILGLKYGLLRPLVTTGPHNTRSPPPPLSASYWRILFHSLESRRLSKLPVLSLSTTLLSSSVVYGSSKKCFYVLTSSGGKEGCLSWDPAQNRFLLDSRRLVSEVSYPIGVLLEQLSYTESLSRVESGPPGVPRVIPVPLLPQFSPNDILFFGSPWNFR